MGAASNPSNRPLSPHLGIWRWGWAMTVSILHRASGDGMAVVGGIVMLWGLYSIASGPESWATYVSWMTWWPGYIVMIGLSWAFFQHMCSGLRHFVLDTGAGYEIGTNTLWSMIVPALGIFFTIAFWAILLL